MYIYVSYEESQYMNYYHVINGKDILKRFIPQEEIEELFDIIKEMIKKEDGLELCIVKSEDASEFEYLDFFQRYNIQSASLSCGNEENIYGTIRDVLSIRENMGILFCGKVFFEESNKITVDSQNYNEQDLSKNEPEKTEFAKIVIEKHERMSQNEHI